MYVCMYVKEKRLELATPNVVDIQDMAVAWHAVILRSTGLR